MAGFLQPPCAAGWRNSPGRGLVDSVSHYLASLGPNPRRRHFPTERGIEAAAQVEHGVERLSSASTRCPGSGSGCLTERLDAVAALYHMAAMIAHADPQGQPVRVDHHRQGPYDLLIALSGGRSLGIVRQGPVLSSANLRYRLRTLENLRQRQRPTATLVLTHSDQATRRAFRTLGDPSEHHSTFVATEGELLAGDAEAPVGQQCGAGNNSFLPEAINPDVSLGDIMAWLGRRAENAAAYRRKLGLDTDDRPTPRPGRAVSQPPAGDDAGAAGAGGELPGRPAHPALKNRPWTCWPPGPGATPASWPG